MIPGLDGLRALAFLIVFGIHIDYLQFGWMGVQMFFVLSGFLITDILLRMKETLPLGTYLYKFYVRRFLRIFPLYYFFLFLMLGLSAWLISISYRPAIMQVIQDQIIFAFLYLYDFFVAYREYQPSRFFDHLWSLSVEEQFYLVWPLLIFLTPEKWLKKMFLAGIAAGPLFRVAFFFAYDMGLSTYLREPVATALYPLPFTHVDAFALGAYISRFPIPHARKQLVLLGALLPLAGFSSQYFATGEAGTLSSLGYPVTMPNAYQFLWAYSAINYWFALLIYCVVNERLFVKFLELPLLRYLGRISYGLYVYHFPVLWFAVRLRDVPGLENINRPLIYLAGFAGTFLISSVSYYALERPFIQLKDRLAAYSRKGESPPSMR
jgi:peptidoglycan/LPS O-acetylase OafA/YrhL